MMPKAWAAKDERQYEHIESKARPEAMDGTRPDGSPDNEIYDRPDDYDLEHEGDEADARFYGRLLRRLHPARVLEFGCGSGRITTALTSALPNCEIVAVDSSPAMLANARRRVSVHTRRRRNEQVICVEGDMRHWQGAGAPFDVVVVAGRSASHLLTLDDRLRTWHNAFRLLRPGGAFVMDVAMPDLATLAESQRVWPRAHLELDVDASRRSGEGPRLLRCTATTYEPHEQRADVRYFYDRFTPDDASRFVSDFQSHIYFPAELELLFTMCGFQTAQRYGDYAFAPFARTSPYLITVAYRPESE